VWKQSPQDILLFLIGGYYDAAQVPLRQFRGARRPIGFVRDNYGLNSICDSQLPHASLDFVGARSRTNEGDSTNFGVRYALDIGKHFGKII
jgi:hypothetical protein